MQGEAGNRIFCYVESWSAWAYSSSKPWWWVNRRFVKSWWIDNLRAENLALYLVQALIYTTEHFLYKPLTELSTAMYLLFNGNFHEDLASVLVRLITMQSPTTILSYLRHLFHLGCTTPPPFCPNFIEFCVFEKWEIWWGAVQKQSLPCQLFHLKAGGRWWVMYNTSKPPQAEGSWRQN